MLIAQLSDLHIGAPGERMLGCVDSAEGFRRCLAALAAVQPAPDLVLATGDLVNGGRPAEYQQLRALLQPLELPLYVIPGNHDDRDALRQAFPDHHYLPGTGYLHYTIEDRPVRLVGLDTVRPGEADGELCRERLEWLDRTLGNAPERPTVIFMHHPPFATGIGYMDAIALRNPDDFRAVLARHRQVERVLCGHVHRPIEVRLGATVAAIAPSTAHPLALDLRPEAPPAFHPGPQGFVLLQWRPGTGLISHVVTVGDFPGPFPIEG